MLGKILPINWVNQERNLEWILFLFNVFLDRIYRINRIIFLFFLIFLKKMRKLNPAKIGGKKQHCNTTNYKSCTSYTATK